MYLIYDTETTGLPKNYNASIHQLDNWPRVVQLAWQLHDEKGNLIENKSFIIKPDGYDIPFAVTQIHGISTEKANREGIPFVEVMEHFNRSVAKTKVIVGHNIEFDQNILGSELVRYKLDEKILQKPILDTMKLSVDYCAMPGGRSGGFKFPKLGELYKKLFSGGFSEAHNAAADVNATARCFFELMRMEVINPSKSGLSVDEFQSFKNLYPQKIPVFAIEIEKQIEAYKTEITPNTPIEKSENQSAISAPYFHFHNHTSYSILSATTKIQELIKKAVDEKMPAVGITDVGNLMGSFHFMEAIKQTNKDLESPIIPVVGCEIYLSEEYQKAKFTKENPDIRYPQLLLAKNHKGYKNLSKLSSIGNIEGYYSSCPRVSKELVLQYKENLIATTGSISSEIPHLILNVGEAQAEEVFAWWHTHFQDDFYVELIRHNLEEEEFANQVLIKFARKYGVKIIAQNNSFYLNQIDAEAHDILLCVRDGEKKETEIGRGRDKRFGFPNNEFYFKTQEQMKKLFSDIPEAIENLSELLEKFEIYSLESEVLLPNFTIPQEFIVEEDAKDGGKRGENAYLKYLTYEGAKKRYTEITPELEERIDFELKTIANTGYPGYFLIVQDFTSQARKMGVSVGPGRGSAAGSVVAYCIAITNVDPIKYDLLFERFLNPDRVSLPDIDIDFDDRGRDKVIEWVVNKYGKDQVAQIITYGTMAGKSAIRDTGRVLNLPLSDTDRIAKKIHLKLAKLINLEEKELKTLLSSDQLRDTMEIRQLAKQHNLEAETIKQAQIIEGSLRNIGTHACGIIITPTNISDLVPMTKAKDSDLLVTQFDNAVVESAGLLKMDFLGLRTLTVINDAIDLIQKNKEFLLNPDDFPLDDPKTFEIFQSGSTIAIFQYESPGMQKHLKALKPDKFDDLIAMNALYRPGPLQYIPNFIDRKHGKEAISYDLPEMEEYLRNTYGITVYQEQVMLLSQKLAGFTKGEADVLRKAMGKKQKSVLDKMKTSFIEGATKNNHPEDKLNKIWTDWEAFAQYAFNKSHSTCYALIAYQTAYLKAHYPAEFMASVLSNNMINIKSVSFFMEECRRMGIPVLCPDVNESSFTFSVNKEGAIRFGMGALKGIGEAAVESIIKEREENGRFVSIFDFVKRVDLRTVNKKTVESLALAGAFDEFENLHRAQFFYVDGNQTVLEKLLRFGSQFQESKNQAQASLFGDGSDSIEVMHPVLPICEEWLPLMKLNKEKEVAGIYLSAHPLDSYKKEISLFQKIDIKTLNENQEKLVDKSYSICGLVSSVEYKTDKNGKEYMIFVVEDYEDQLRLMLFDEDFLKNRHWVTRNQFLFIRLQITKNNYTQRIFIKVQKIELLQNVMEIYTKKVEIQMDVESLDENKINQLQEFSHQFKGEKELVIKLKDNTSNQEIAMTSLSKKIKINPQSISFLNEAKIEYQIS
jgi:DNA polymerase III subunit alpha